MRTQTPDDVYLDTVSLLQEEITRLEGELLLRDDSPREVEPETNHRQAQFAEARIIQLTAAVAERDETIQLLWDQLTGLEEIEAARTAEWEQLNRWVEELEARVENPKPAAAAPEARLAQQEIEALRDQLESQRRTWETQRGRFLDEIAELRSQAEEERGAPSNEALATLQHENRSLREECRRLADLEVEAADAELLREQVRSLRDQVHSAFQDLELAKDEANRVRIEQEAEKAALRTRLTTERVVDAGPPTSDERVRALREHLREVHDREERTQKEKQLSTRIARLWRRSTPR